MEKKKVNEGLAELAGAAEQDHEVQMARADLYKIAKYAIKLHDMLRNVSEETGLEGWQQSKITKASDYISSVYHNLDYKLKLGNKDQEAMAPDALPATESTKVRYRPLETSDPYKASLYGRLQEKTIPTKAPSINVKEKAVSKDQQRAAAIALKHKREGTKPKPGTASAEMMSMSTSDLEKYAGTKHKGLPKEKK